MLWLSILDDSNEYLDDLWLFELGKWLEMAYVGSDLMLYYSGVVALVVIGCLFLFVLTPVSQYWQCDDLCLETNPFLGKFPS